MTLFRSTFVELISPFLLTFSVTSFVLIMQRLYSLVRLMVEKLFTVQDVGLMLVYLLPDVFAVTVPLGVVGAVFGTVIRQSVDSEIICAQASGCSLWKFSLPILTFGLLATVLTAGLTIWIQPEAYKRYTGLQAEIIKAHADEKLKPGRFNYQFGGKAIQIGAKSADNELSDIFIADRNQRTSSSVILASKGRIEVDDDAQQVMFRLRDGMVYIPGNTPEVLRTVKFEQLSYRLSFEPQGSGDSRVVKRKSTVALWKEAHAFPPGVIGYYHWMLQFYSRLVLPWACLVFALTSIPMAIVEPRSGKSGSFLRAVFLVVTFYIIWIGFKDLVFGGKAPPEILIMAPSLVLVYGLLRMWQVNGNVRIFAFLPNRARRIPSP
jgi:LPS export ABC transporter permease LptF